MLRLQIDTEKYSDLLRRLTLPLREDAADVSEAEGVKAIHCILIDTYALNSQKVKDCAEKIGKQYRQIGRREKWLIKRYLDYGEQGTLTELRDDLDCSDDDFSGIVEIINGECADLSEEAEAGFIKIGVKRRMMATARNCSIISRGYTLTCLQC